MATEDKRHQFEQIVDGLTADYPSLSRAPRRRWPRPVRITALVVAGLVWGLLSVAMVAWGARGVVLACTVVAITAAVFAVDAQRQRR